MQCVGTKIVAKLNKIHDVFSTPKLKVQSKVILQKRLSFIEIFQNYFYIMFRNNNFLSNFAFHILY